MKHITFTLSLLCLLLIQVQAQNIEVPQTQRSLVIKHTATWCPPCGAQAWDTYEELLKEYENQAVFLQAHRSRSSLFFSENAQDLFNNADASFSQPEFFFNTTRVSSSGTTAGQIGSRIETAAAAEPMAQTGILLNYEPVTKTLDVKAKTRFFKAAGGNFYLSVFLVVHDTIGFQESRGQGQLHKRVLRRALTGNTFGNLLGADLSAGAEKEIQLSATMDESALERVQVVAIIWRQGSNGKFEFINANSQNEVQKMTTSRRDLALLRNAFSVYPTNILQSFTVDFDLPRAYPQAELTLFNLLGQPVRTFFRGALPAGEQRLQLDRPAGLSPGIYLLRLAAGKDMATRRVFLN